MTSTGHLEIDDGHRALLDLVRRLDATTGQETTGERATEQQLIELLNEVITTVTEHFVAEERLMKRSEYAAAHPVKFASHVESHADFAEHLCKAVCRMDEFSTDSLARLGSMIREFAELHWHEHDRRFAERLGAGG